MFSFSIILGPTFLYIFGCTGRKVQETTWRQIEGALIMRVHEYGSIRDEVLGDGANFLTLSRQVSAVCMDVSLYMCFLCTESIRKCV